ncbi:MAG TPA: PhnD/SsuA/transferrin family substrate-binding protein [Xanthobacteraceae bacterium]|nr:PhnD/SsuA/transferrin family substrate-binding protein [Xanthobacteraceae bacterium]
MKLQLSLAVSSNPRTWPILDGTVAPDGIELVPTVLHPSEMFWRQLRFGDFDVSEMSVSSLLMARAGGDERWLGLPVFTTRKFFHTEILVRRDAKIDRPSDLKGRRVGVPEYQQTAALWTRGVLQHEFGVAPTEMEFFMERVPTHSHAGATAFKAPPGVTIRQIPAEKSIGSMMLSGELEAVIHYIVNKNLVDRSTVDLANHRDIKFLFPDPWAEGVRFYRKTNIYPINHGMVIRRELAEKHPWVVLNLLKAFEAANEITNQHRIEHIDYHATAGLIEPEAAKALRQSIIRHGIAANRLTLETAATYSVEQGLTPRLMKLDEIFAASTMDQ